MPVSDAALAVLEKQKAIRSGDCVFAGRDDTHVSKYTVAKVLQLLGRSDLTLHGFRSTFSDWCTECTRFTTEWRWRTRSARRSPRPTGAPICSLL